MVLPASPPRFKNGDSEYRYRPDSELYYLTGWAASGCIAVLRGAEKDFVLFAEGPDEAKELWTGPRPDLPAVRESLGASEVYPLDEFTARAPGLLKGAEVIHYRLGASEACDRVVLEALRDCRRSRPRTGTGPHGVQDPGVILDPLRLRKDRAEIARMRVAAKITAAAFRDGLAAVRPGAGEWEVEAALESGFRRRGADGPAFSTIVASGANACTLHYTANASRLAAGELVLVDAGAEFAFYAADVSRTVPVSGRMEGAARDAYEVVLEARRAAIACCRPGVSVARVHEAAVRAVTEGLLGMGVLRGSADQAVEEGACRPYFPHQTSHWLGLDTHDAGSYQDKNGALALAPGVTLTVEPGLYFRPDDCPRVRELEGTGIRIEDDVLITEDGAEILTEDLPADANAVEELVGG